MRKAYELRPREGIKKNASSWPGAGGRRAGDITKSSPTLDDYLEPSSTLDVTEETRLRHREAARPKSGRHSPVTSNDGPSSQPSQGISDETTQPADGTCLPPPYADADDADADGISPKTEPSNFKFQHKVCLGVVVLAVIIWVALTCRQSDESPPIVRFTDQAGIQVSVIRWQEEVVALMKRFPYQRTHLWRVLRATVSRMLLESRQPAVVLLLASEAQRDDVNCVLRAAADAVLNATRSPARPLRVDGATLGALDLQEAKGRLNTELGQLRGGDGVAVFMVEELQQLQPFAAMLLHGYCDNDNAPRKKAVFLLSAVTRRTPPGDADVSLAVEHTLWQSWGKVLGEDIFYALLARIAGNVATVADEGSELLCHKTGQ